jgi:Arc/MetJ family transcription regulator
MTYWDSNRAIIKEKFPGLLKQLNKPWHEGDIHIETAASGDPTLIIQNISIHSRRDPKREGQRLAATLNGTGPIIILGFGLGYAAEGALEKTRLSPASVSRPIIIVERHAAVLRKALEIRNLHTFLSANPLIFVLGGSEDGLTGVLQFCETHFPNGKAPLEFIRNHGLMQLDADWYAGVERHIRTWTSKDAVNLATLRRFGIRWVRNGARNLEAIRDLPGIDHLAGTVAPNIPTFLAAAGPSLDRIAGILPDIRERCVVVAVDTALRLFAAAGVDPDFAVVVDPQYWNARHLDHISLPKTRLIAESTVYPPVLRHPCAGIFLCASLYPLGRFIEARLEPKGRLAAGGSVATTAWDFARILGSSSIWIAGLDLAFPGFKTHFKGARFEEQALLESSRFNPGETRSFRALRDGNPFWAAAADGSRVLTDQRLALYASWFETRFHGTPGLKNYRMYGEGLALSGLITSSPEALLALPIRRPAIDRYLGKAFSHVQNRFMRPEHVQERRATYDAALKELLEGLTTFKSLADAALEILGSPHKSNSPEPQDASLFRKNLDAIAGEIAASPVKAIVDFLVPVGDASSLTLYQALSDAAQEHIKQIVQGRDISKPYLL